MASATWSVRTEDAINVSQDAVSSPTHHNTPQHIEVSASQDIDDVVVSHMVQLNETAEMVEDSYPRETAGEPGQSTHRDNDEEELYETTPIKSTTKKPVVEMPNPHPSANNGLVSGAGTSLCTSGELENAKLVKRRSSAQDAIASLLADGAKAQSGKQTGSKSVDIVHLIRDDGGKDTAASKTSKDPTPSSAPKPSKLPQVKRSKDLQPPTTVHQPSGLPTPGISGKRQPAVVNITGQSSAAALRARREARDGVSKSASQASKKLDLHEPAPGENQDVTTLSAHVVALEETNRRSQRPRKIDDSPQETAATAQVSAEQQRTGAKDTNKLVGTKRTKELSSSRKKEKKSINRPDRVQPPRDAKHSDPYEMPHESEPEPREWEEPPAKKPRTTEPTAPKVATGSGSKAKKLTAAAVRTPRATNNTHKKLVASSRRKASAQTKPTKAANTAKARMKEMDDRVANNASDSPVKQDTSLVGKASGSKRSSGKNPVQVRESLEDFENEVVQYEEEDPDKDDQGYTLGDQNEYQRAEHGASQENAIILSDYHSASRGQSPERTRRQPHAGERAPTTPANIRSSPPVGDVPAEGDLGPALVDPEMAKRSNIISFDKSGPRNQGTFSERKLGFPSTRTDRSSLAPAHTVPSSELKDEKGRQSRDPKDISLTQDTVDQPKEATRDVSHAFPGVLKGRATTNTQQTEPRGLDPEGQLDKARHNHGDIHDNDGYMDIDDFEETTMVANGSDGDRKTTHEALAPTASQQAMPPPPSKVKETTVTSAQKLRQPRRTPTVPSMSLFDGHKTVSQDVETLQRVAPAKRSARSPPPKTPPLKRPRDSDVEARTGQISEAVQPSKPPRSTVTLPPHNRQHLVSQDPMKHQFRKASRHASRGSQSVDINGSPVGDDVVVDGTRTALETFSRQAALKSDPHFIDNVSSKKPKASKVTNIHSDVSLLPPPSAQSRKLTSNVNTRPALPQEHSRAITTHGRTESGRLIVEDEVSKPKKNPFTSSDEAQRLTSGTNSSTFLQQLKKFAEEKKRATLPSQVQGDDDPDKTLVEHIPPSRVIKRHLSISSASSSADTSQTDKCNDTMRDISVWRNGLLPHQVDLFDELVSVSHQIIRHLVDHETAARDLVEDYRRRGIRLVEQMESSQTAQYQQYVSGLQDRKKRMREDLDRCSRKLSDVKATVEGIKRKRFKKAEQGVVLEGMQSIIQQYC